MVTAIARLSLLPLICCIGACDPSTTGAGEKVASGAESWERPNIIYILSDDLGYGDIGAYGQDRIHTPTLDRMAEEGLVFAQHYAGSTVCAPSRAVLMTGQDTGRVRIRGNLGTGGFRDEEEKGQMPLESEVTSLAEVLKGGGYATALAGKWGLGGPGTPGVPTRHGFDYFFGYLDQKQAHNYYPTHLWENETRIPLNNEFFIPHADKTGGSTDADDYLDYSGNDYAPDRITDAAVNWIRANAKHPFFLYLAFTAPHAALQVPDEELAQYEGAWPEQPLNDGQYTPHPKPRAARAGMISHMDSDINRILEVVAELGLDNNTVIMFSSDNGPGSEGGADLEFFDSTGGLRGQKRDLYEGGIRVPMIVRWPGVISPGQRTDHLSAFWDILPTFAELAGQPIPDDTDGISMLPLLLGQEQQAHESLYWEFHSGAKGIPTSTVSSQAVRMGNWKAVRRRLTDYHPIESMELYDIVADRTETNDVAALHPEVVRQIAVIMEQRELSEFDVWNFQDHGQTPDL